MKIIGVTGGVGAGKSTVLHYLKERWEARVLKTDEAGHLVMEPGKKCYQQIVSGFGTDILYENTYIDRKKLGEIVFQDKEKLQILNQFVHPAVKKYVLEELEIAKIEKIPYFVIESALLFEENYDALCDEVWYIYAKEEVRCQRIQKERGYSNERIQGILKNQASAEEFRKKCNYTIENNGDFKETSRQIDERIQTL